MTLLIKILIMFMITQNIYGQNKALHYIGISGGCSVPFGSFSKSEYKNNNSGYAGTGYQIGLDGAYYFNKRIGIGGLFSYNNFSVADASIKNLGEGYVEDFGVDDATVTIKNSNVVMNYFVGPYFSIPLNKITFDFRALAGLSTLTTPEIKVVLEDGDPFYQRSATGAALGFALGAGARLHLYKSLGMALRVDYNYSDQRVYVNNENRLNNAGRYIDNYHAAVPFLNASVGLIYQFGDK